MPVARIRDRARRQTMPLNGAWLRNSASSARCTGCYAPTIERKVGVELVENEVVHLYHGLYIGEIRPDAKEVEAFVWTSREILLSDIRKAARKLYLLVQTLRTFFRGSVVSRRRGLSLSDR